MRRLIAVALAALVGLPPATVPAATGEDAALAVAGELVEGAHGALTDPALDPEARFAALSAVIGRVFAFDIWERFLLGDRAAAFSDDQLADFRTLLPGFIARLYANQFGKGLDRRPEIVEARPVRGDVLVRARIPRASGGNLPVDWRIRDIDGAGARVIDVMVGGTSFLILKREEFGALLDSGGPAALIAYMREFVSGE